MQITEAGKGARRQGSGGKCRWKAHGHVSTSCEDGRLKQETPAVGEDAETGSPPHIHLHPRATQARIHHTHATHTPRIAPNFLVRQWFQRPLTWGYLLPICPSPDTSTTSSYSQQRVISALILQEKIPKDQLCLTYLWGVCVCLCVVCI